MLNRLFTLVLLGLFLVGSFLCSPVQAADLENGKKLFNKNCAQCHRGGMNVVIKDKNLSQEALEKYDMFSVEAIAYQITNGKNAMPAFGRRLKPDQIEDVANYVYSQAQSGW